MSLSPVIRYLLYYTSLCFWQSVDSLSCRSQLLFSQQLVNGSSVCHPSSVLLYCIAFPDSRWMTHYITLTLNCYTILHCVPDSQWIACYVAHNCKYYPTGHCLYHRRLAILPTVGKWFIGLSSVICSASLHYVLRQSVNGSSCRSNPSSIVCFAPLHCVPDSRWMTHYVTLSLNCYTLLHYVPRRSVNGSSCRSNPSSIVCFAPLHCVPDSWWMAHYITLTLNCYTLLHYVPRQSVNGSSYRSPVVCHPLYCVVWQSVSRWMLLTHLWIAFTHQHILSPTVGKILTGNLDDLNECILSPPVGRYQLVILV